MAEPQRTATVLVTTSDAGVVTVALDRPAQRNALDAPTVAALRDAVAAATGPVVLRAAGPGAFCAGADLTISDAERAQVSRDLYALYGEMLAAPVPIIAALHGPAVGGGAQLAVASDLRIGSPEAWIRFVGPGHGLAVGPWALPSLVGRGRAIDLCLSGRRVDAREASAIGLLDRLVDDPVTEAHELATGWAALDRDAVARVKAIVGASAARDAALALERDGNADWAGAGP